MKKFLISLAGLLTLVFLPYVLWQLHEKEQLNVKIIDYTVPDESFREHKSLTWLLNHNHYVQSDGERYRKNKNYLGFFPNEEEESYKIREETDAFEESDLIYVADTYGVYESDLPWEVKKSEDSAESELIYGGLSGQLWEEIKQKVVMTGKDLIMEFNTFASPTSDRIRKDVTEFLNVEWTGWIGRHFSNLNKKSSEIPSWVIKRYEKTEGEWTFQGEGIVLIDEFSEKVVVLSEQAGDVNDAEITMAFTEEGRERFGLEESSHYPYWFDILKPQSQDQVLAEYNWNLSEDGQSKLEEEGIPLQFPAVMHLKKGQSNVYYFSGDYADFSEVPSFYQYAGFSNVRKWFSWLPLNVQSKFFWGTYSPMMEEILSSISTEEDSKEVAAVEQAEMEGLSFPAKIEKNELEVYQNGEWETLTIKGVNLGMAKPGTFPGEAAIKLSEYKRWFEMIGEMNANAIRVYTLHPPEFYKALADYNANAEQPLYVFHGVWIEEQPLEEKLDAFNEEITTRFQTEMKKIVDVIHGEATVAPERGHASGTYSYDISPYVIGWVIGIEWYPYLVDQMNKDYPELGDYEGEYTYTEGANPMEYWLAEQMDALMTYEVEHYQSMRPLSFTNWVTTDNLAQPAEPSEQEDLATIDPNHIKPKNEAEITGMFASYHVYPYYPDFLNLEEKYTEYRDHRGEENNYAGYLNDLNKSHDMPILIAEFGIPASRGMTHRNVHGMNQGFISEVEQGKILARLYEDIIQEDMLGGMIFTWQDEWFKRTWNTMDYDNPDRRPFWSNAQTNEQHFGLLSFDRLKVKVDGEDDWKDGETFVNKQQGLLREFQVDHDERYLYIKSKLSNLDKAFWKEQDYQIYFSVRENKGIAVEGTDLLADFRLTIENEKSAKLEVAGDYDPFFYDYASRLKMISVTDEEMKNKAEVFHPIRLALNKEQIRPDTGEVLPFESYETGILRFGNGNPASENYDSLADYYYSEDTGILEIRLPWMLLNARDPSQKEFIGDLWSEGVDASMHIEGIEIAPVVTNSNEIVASFEEDRFIYEWENWNLPKYEERLKKSYSIIQELFSQIP